jgi:hypothetical protein
MSVVGCLLKVSERPGRRRTMSDDTMHDGWCPDCDLRSAVVDLATGWAECTECGIGWTERDDDAASTRVAHEQQPLRTAA